MKLNRGMNSYVGVVTVIQRYQEEPTCEKLFTISTDELTVVAVTPV